MRIEERVKEAGTPDIAHHHDLIAVKPHALEGFVKDIAQSIKKGLEPPMLVELSAGAKLAKDSSTEVNADVKVVYKDPQHPFKLSIGVNLKKLSDSLPKIARQFAEGTQPAPPEPPPPPQPT